MRILLPRAAVLALALAVSAWPAAAAGQRAPSVSPGDAEVFADTVRTAVAREARDSATQDDAAAAERRWQRKRHLPAIGAAIGAGVGAVITFAAANRYGNNEGSGTCGACVVRWGLVAVPVGAGAGAAVGFAMRGRRPTAAAPAAAPPAGASAFLGWRQDVSITVRF